MTTIPPACGPMGDETMSGAVLDFENGYIAVERCESADKPGEFFLMAHAVSKTRGTRTSAPVSTKAAFDFATAIVRHALLADGHHEDELDSIRWIADRAEITELTKP